MARYDYLIVGTGFFGAVFAHEAAACGKKCLVIDRRDHVGGNAYCEKRRSIWIHRYGPHIFHTNDKRIWNYVRQFAEFNNFINSPLANYHGKIYNLPFNMNTFNQLWCVTTPRQAKMKIAEQTAPYKNVKPSNLEEQALALAGPDIYEHFIRDYTEKQWGRSCAQLPPFIIKRIPLRFTYNNNYFNDKYQGIPIGGYARLFTNLLKHCDVQLSTDFFADKSLRFWADRIVYTGTIDRYFGYCYSPLEYRTVTFKTEELDIEDYQGNAVVNYTSADAPFTRIIEHKHFEFGKQSFTVITKEFPAQWNPGKEPFYPVQDERNIALYKKYAQLATQEKNVIFGGRLAEYQYYNMDEAVRRALLVAKKELKVGMV
ncbi:MAG: UDP-galactopyranose mutase [Pyramidobacter sp.]|jgi:UDP-galactopyranose mutase